MGRCIIIGGKGFVGRAIAAEARARGLETLVADQAEYESLRGADADLVINANGNSKKFLAREDPAREFDLSVRSVARALQDFKAGLYVQLSTIDVYPDTRNPEHNAETEVIDEARLSPYGLHKLLAEKLVRYYAPRRLILRMGGFVGSGLWKNSIYDLLKGRPLRVHPDSLYQYLHTRDLARILFTLIERGAQNEVFNVAGDGLLSPREIAAWIPGASPPVESDEAPRERYEVNVRKIKQVVDLPKTTDTVRRFVEDARAGREALS